MSWGDEEETSGPVYADADAWLGDWFAPRWRRSWESAHCIWCPEYHRHPEAVDRLDALWQAWEARYSRDPASWWLNVCDPMMASLTDEAGCFKACRNGHSDRLGPLPFEAA